MKLKSDMFRGKRVLVTGGAGFVGSNLVISLVQQGAIVTAVDNMSPNQGGNVFNLDPVKDKITLDYSDIRDKSAMTLLVREKDYIFHLARQTDHILSQTDPYPDIDVNIRGSVILLEAIRHNNSTAKLIYVGTRGQYGPAVKLPVAEDAPTNPKGIYELTNLAAEKMVKIYHDNYGIKSIMLRLTNIYGPRAQMKSDHYGVVNWFIRVALEGGVIKVFGDGKLKRDFLYIDDAVDAMLATTLNENCYGQIINVGDDKPDTFLNLIKTIVEVVGSGSFEFTPFTKERLLQEPGDFASDITKINQLTGWKPTTALADGLKKTADFYREYKKHYW
jgi:UDP-glucose 4-epimerase